VAVVFDLQFCDSDLTPQKIFDDHGLYEEDLWEVLDEDRWLIFPDSGEHPESRRKLIGPNSRGDLLTIIIQVPEQGEQYPCVVTAYPARSEADRSLYASGGGTRHV